MFDQTNSVKMKYLELKTIVIEYVLSHLIYNFYFVKFFGRLVIVWPLDKNTDRWKIALHNCAWYFFYINNWGLLIPTIYAYYKQRCCFSELLTVGIELGVITESLMSMILSRVQKHRLQMMLEISYEFVCLNTTQNLSMMRRFSQKYAILIGVTCVCYGVVLFLSILTSITANPIQFVSHAYYPRSVTSSSVIWIILYGHQLVVTFYTSIILIVDVLIVLMICVATLKLHLLSFKIKNLKVYSDLVECVIEHKNIIWFVNEINLVIRFFILKTIGSLVYYLLTLALTLFNADVSRLTKLQFLVLLFIGLLRLYLYASCAQSMSTWGDILSFDVYSSRWYTQSRKMIFAKSIIICISQKPLHITIPGVIPSLNMNYVAHFLYMVYSYFTTLRTITSAANK